MRMSALLLAATMGACSLFTSLDDFTTDEREPDVDVPADGTAPPDAADGAAPLGEDASDSGPLLADAGGPSAVDAGCTRRPSSAFNATPDGSDGVICGATSILELDGIFAGLDRLKYYATFVPVAGEEVQACVGARFDEDVGRRIVVHAAPLRSACGGSCGYNEGECRDTQTMKIFRGPSDEALEYLDTLVLTHDDAGVKSYVVTGSPMPSVRVIVVCRGGNIGGNDFTDVGVDFVEADCPESVGP